MVNSIITFSDIILWWDIKDKVSENESYYIILNGEMAGTTDKTHFTLRNVSESSGKIEIYNDESCGTLFWSSEYTLPEKPRFIDVTKAPYNAVPDGVTVNTRALQSAIDDCGAGECVYFPEGVFLTGALVLHSDMELYVAEGAEIRGSTVPSDYLPRILSRFEGIEMECYSSLINIGNIYDRDSIVCENVIIHGGGKILGGSRPLALNVLEEERKRLEADPSFEYDPECENNDTIPGRVRPKLFNISCAKNVIIDNLDVGNGSCWNLHMIYSKDIVTCNCRFHSFDVWNGDGWDPDSSDNCILFNCDFHTGDDCIAIKSGKNPEGNVIGRPCTNVKIFDCRATYGHSIAIGSEMSGGIDGVYIWDCDFSNTVYGIHIKGTKKRGGYIKNIHMTNCSLARVSFHCVPYNDDGIAAPTVPIFSDCHFENIVLTGQAVVHQKVGEFEQKDAIQLTGFDDEHKTQNITFNNITIDNSRESVTQTISLQMVKNISITNLNVR